MQRHLFGASDPELVYVDNINFNSVVFFSFKDVTRLTTVYPYWAIHLSGSVVGMEYTAGIMMGYQQLAR